MCGPMSVKSPGGKRYIAAFLDDYSRYCRLYFLQHKSEAFDAFIDFKTWAEKQTSHQLKRFRSDGGGEYVSRDFEAYLKKSGIQVERSAPYCPQQNGAAERLNRTLVEMARTMLHHAGATKGLWAEAAATASYLYNRLPTTATGVTPHKRWCGADPDLRQVRVWGSVGYAQIPKQQRKGKFGKKSERVRLLGYPSGIKGYKVQSLETGAVSVRRDVIFNETDFGRQNMTRRFEKEKASMRDDREKAPSAKSTWIPDLGEEEQVPALPPPAAQPDLQSEEESTQADSPGRNSATLPRERIALRINRRLLPSASNDSVISPGGERQEETPRRTTRERKTPIRFGIDEYVSVLDEYAFAGAEDDPKTIQEALQRPDAKQWKEAADEEFQALQDNGTWELVPLPAGRKAIGSRWVFRVKRDEDGRSLRHKARLVAQGFSQRPGVDYEETFAPVVRFDAIRTLVALAASTGYLLHQVDVETAFLHGRLEEEVYMKQPPGYEDVSNPNAVCRLIKSLYGLKQSPRAWNLALHEHLLKTGFKQSSSDPCIYVYETATSEWLLLAIYVDDILIVAPSEAKMQWVKARLAARFKIKDLGRAHHLLGMKIRRNEAGILMTQTHYIEDLIKKMGFEEAKPMSTPADPNVALVMNDGYSADVDLKMYQALVGSLLYAAVATRPDIAHAVGVVCRFTSRPTTVHYTAAKRILRYLKATKELGLYYRAGQDDIQQLIGYCDADWAGDKETRRSTMGHCFQLANCVISWISQRQPVVTLSSTEAEYVALSSAAQQAVWLRGLLKNLGYPQKKATTILEDNQGAICLARNPVAQRKTKHIDLRHHYIREKVTDDTLDLQFIGTSEMVADLLTKPLHRATFERLRGKCGLRGDLESRN
ncbi:MAG: DDE-type integrase/transposase/recombinase [Gammaproteobacteria bacterium]|nr:DDE-type integrase/transposase/recombinase [Gammaproteobacteria bacterium]